MFTLTKKVLHFITHFNEHYSFGFLEPCDICHVTIGVVLFVSSTIGWKYWDIKLSLWSYHGESIHTGVPNQQVENGSVGKAVTALNDAWWPYWKKHVFMNISTLVFLSHVIIPWTVFYFMFMFLICLHRSECSHERGGGCDACCRGCNFCNHHCLCCLVCIKMVSSHNNQNLMHYFHLHTMSLFIAFELVQRKKVETITYWRSNIFPL